ncbi:MAG: hypothetical protein HY291_12215 [Planctomycetes bacterium]|nr:hypothetical protein [Planctomycetota bacterium]
MRNLELRRALTMQLLACVLSLAVACANAAEPAPNQWTPVNEPPAGVQLLGWDELRYAPELEGVLFYGAYRSFTSENQNAIWVYRYKENRWHLLHINMFYVRDELASDGGHSSGKMFYDENRKVMVYGGLVSMSRNDRARTWIFDPAAAVGWDANPPGPVPGIAFDGTSTYVPDWKAGFQYSCGAGTWSFDALANKWAKLATGQGPASTCEPVYDPKHKRILAFGGSRGHYGGKAFETLNDLWAFDLAAKTWSKLETKNPPPTRGWPQLALSPAHDILMLCGGASGAMDKNGNAEFRNDTWTLDLGTLEWTKLESATSPPTSYSNHMAYDPQNDVFLLVSGRTTKNLGYGYPCQMYALQYAGKAAAKAPAAAVPAAPMPAYDFKALPKAEKEWAAVGSGPVSAVQGWGFRPSLASNGAELLLAFGEYDPPGKYGDEGCYVYAFKYGGGSWSRLGSRAVSDVSAHAQAPSAAFDAAGKPVVAYLQIKQWKPAQLTLKRFDGDWKAAGEIALDGLPGMPALAGGAQPLAIAWQHHPKNGKGIGAFVDENSGDAWQPVGDGKALNVDDPGATRGQFVALVRDPQGRLVAAWSEQKAGYEGENTTPERIHVKRFEGGKWALLGTELPISKPQSRALGYAIAIHNGEPVVAVCDGTDGGQAALLVYAWSGGQWKALGDAPLNVLGKESGALKPALVSDGKNLFVAWPEFQPHLPPLLFAKKWDGSKWSLAGGPLNIAPGKGSAQTPMMALLNGKPVVAWSELVPLGDGMRQIFVKTMP